MREEQRDENRGDGAGAAAETRADHWPRSTTLLAIALMCAIWAVRVLPELGPVPSGGLYNSDSAIPVLMSNLATGDRYDWLFWGQDRFGAWPFLAARLLGLSFHAVWTPHRLHVLQALWFVSALVPWLLLASRGRAVAAAGFLLLPALTPVLGTTLVDVGTVDGWQLPALLWGWWGLRRMLLVGASTAAALATWTSLTSAPLLLILAVLEGFRARASRTRRLALCIPAVTGVLVESSVRAGWHAAVHARGWRDLRTPASLDVGHLVDNALAMAEKARVSAVIPWLLAIGLVGLLAALRVLKDERSDPTAWTLVEAAACSWMAVLIPVLVRHVRENAYNARYLGIGLAFAVLGVTLALGALLDLGLRRLRPHLAEALVGLLALGAVLFLLPAARPDPRERALEPLAEAMAARFPGAAYVDRYWKVYAVAALAQPWAVVPIPFEGEWNRRPDWLAFLRTGGMVLVGSTASPPLTRIEHGIPLVLVAPDVLVSPPLSGESAAHRISLYRAETPRL